jgi:hypothetical protein
MGCLIQRNKGLHPTPHFFLRSFFSSLKIKEEGQKKFPTSTGNFFILPIGNIGKLPTQIQDIFKKKGKRCRTKKKEKKRKKSKNVRERSKFD